MQSVNRGSQASPVEIAEVTEQGFTLLAAGERLYLPYDQFPWFRRATPEQLRDVKLWPPDHLQWESMDIDLCIDSIHHPEKYPLIARFPEFN